jgi:hypothetical protein
MLIIEPQAERILERLCVSGRLILDYILKEWDIKPQAELNWLGRGHTEETGDHNATTISEKCCRFELVSRLAGAH